MSGDEVSQLFGSPAVQELRQIRSLLLDMAAEIGADKLLPRSPVEIKERGSCSLRYWRTEHPLPVHVLEGDPDVVYLRPQAWCDDWTAMRPADARALALALLAAAGDAERQHGPRAEATPNLSAFSPSGTGGRP